MRRLTDTDGLSDVQRDILRTVRDFVDNEVLPVAAELDRTDTYPDKIVERLKELGVFGLTISERYGGLGESLLTYALVVEELSRGMKQRLGIGRAIIHQPKVLLLDEPASGLDPKARLELRNLLRWLQEQGTTILISSHILTELEGFCTSSLLRR